MNGRRLTDAHISQALHVHLPQRAPAGLRERILDAAQTTTQQGALPSFLGGLSDADPVTRRRSLLIAAALLVAVALSTAAVIGALRIIDRDPVRELSVEPPATSAPNPSGPSTGPTPSPVTNPAGVWIATGTMGTPRFDHTAVRLLDGRVLVVGGSNGDRTDTSAELYDPNNGTWSATGSMLRPHAGFAATLLRDGRVLVGDVDDPDADEPITGAELYDPESGTWAATGEMVQGAHLFFDTATLLRDGKVLVAGLNGVQLYDPASGTWSATEGLTTPRYHHTATLLPDGRVLVAGGDVPPDLATDSAELYDPASGTWTATANLRATGNTRFDTIRATLLQDGTVLVVRPSTAELYDPATGTWTATGAQRSAGTGSTILLTDGRLFVAGGVVSPDLAPDPTELYDPDIGAWTTAAPMLRSHGTPAILLLDGTVLVAGGNDCSDTGCVATGSAELYIPAGVAPPRLPAFPNPPPPVFPNPTAIPTPYPPEAGPVPAGARSWNTTVRNESSEPATLFLAEGGENGIGELCGSVTPNVVPAGVTERVTFLLPPKTVKGCWIWVNPAPGQGGSLFETSDAPLAVEIFIDAGGQVMYG